ncbi:hypothetical protein [Peribacillus alkalitolerans]|uniref:hypothetical protein n=1 Tax=Peribacillus alkalitolerans TaxID=1550385 RepID=UPI0013D01C56|nr:hypothetical protein [Peribacillus alkalitolerans]
MAPLVIMLEKAETRMDRINRVEFGNEDCSRYFRIEIRNPDGKRSIYRLKSDSKKIACRKAGDVIHTMNESD